MAGKRFSVETVFESVDRLTRPIDKMQNRVSRFTRSFSRGLGGVQRLTGKVTDGIKTAGVAATVAFGAVSAVAAKVITTGATFEQTLVNAAAKFGGSARRGTEEFEALEKAARKAGSTTEFTASEAAEGLNFLAMAGFDAQASIAALPGVIDLATAAQVDLGTASDIATDSLGALNLMTKDTGQLGENLARVNDLIAKTTTTANTNVEQMFEAIKEAGPSATNAGASIESLAAMIGELANAGIKGGRAGTALKNIFLRLAAPADAGASALEQLGVKTIDADGNLRDIFDIIQDLQKGMQGLGTGVQAGLLDDIFGKIPIAAVNVLLNAGSDRLREYTGQLKAAAGASGSMADTMRDTVQGRINSLKSAIEGVTISLFSLNRGPIAETLDKMIAWTRANEGVIASGIADFVSKIYNNFDQIVEVLTRVGKAVAAIFLLNMALKVLITVMTLVNLVLAANPITLIVLGIVLLLAGLVLAFNKYGDQIKAAWRSVADYLSETWQTVSNLFNYYVYRIRRWINEVMAGETVANIKEAWGGLKTFFSDLWGAVVSKFQWALNAIKPITRTIAEAAKGVSSFFGFGDDEDGDTGRTSRRSRRGASRRPVVVSPSERVARSISESHSSSTSEVTIKDETGRAEVTRGALGEGLTIEQSGAM